MAVFSGLPDSAHLVPKRSSARLQRGATFANSNICSTICNGAGGKGGQQLLTSWIRPKMPSTVQSSTEDRGRQRLLTSWMRPKSSPAPTVSAAPVTATEYISPSPKVCAATVLVVEISCPALAASYAETERCAMNSSADTQPSVEFL